MMPRGASQLDIRCICGRWKEFLELVPPGGRELTSRGDTVGLEEVVGREFD